MSQAGSRGEEEDLTLLSKNGEMEEEEEQSGGEEEEESGSEEEEEEGSGGGEEDSGSEEEEEEEGESKGGEEEESVSEEEEEGESDGEEEEGGVSGREGEALGGEDDEEQESDGDSGDSDDDDDDDDGGGDEEEGGGLRTEEDIKKELSSMSFEEVLSLRRQVGTKVYDQVARGPAPSQATPPPRPHARKRLNKNRPMEISSKRHAPFLRQVVPVKKPVLRDPRFDDLSGDYKPEIFEKTYRFINDIKHREREVVQKKMTKATRANQKDKLQFLLKRMDNQERARLSREQQREKELAWRRGQREAAGAGLRPYYLKNSDRKKLQLADKYQDLKKNGRLDSFLAKKRKRNAGKDRRKLPSQAPPP